MHIKVIDNTGSTAFILFDRVVNFFIGKSAKDVLEENERVHLK